MKRRLRLKGYNEREGKVKNYGEWLKERGGVEHIPPEQEWDGCQPWSIRASTALEEDQLEVLEQLYHTLKGRQRQVIDLLREGVLNQAEIARRLGISRQNVVIHLRRIEKKIKKMCSGLG